MFPETRPQTHAQVSWPGIARRGGFRGDDAGELTPLTRIEVDGGGGSEVRADSAL